MSDRYDTNLFGQEDSRPREPADDYGDDSKVDISLSSDADLRAKEKELKAKEAELSRKEEELKRKEAAIVLCIVACLVWNLAAVTVIWIKGEETEIWFIALIYLITGVLGAYFLWYRPLYRAMRSNGALMFGYFFVTYTCHLFFCITASIAPPIIFRGKSITGILPALEILPRDGMVGCLYFIGFALFALESAISIWVIQDVYRYFRTSGKAAEAKRDAKKSTMMVALGHG